jgi:type II secretion system protein C
MQILPVVTKLLITLLVAKLLSLFIWWYLPSEGVELNTKGSYQAKYHRVDFKNMLVETSKEHNVAYTKGSSFFSIESLVLKGLYGNTNKGFAIVAQKSKPLKTTIVGLGESYEGYRLKEIDNSSVLFSKGSKEYILKLENSKLQTLHKGSNDGEISEALVSRKDIRRYSKNPSKIWKDISISAFKKAGKIVGFRVNHIKVGSKMDTLGLKRGDLIIRANNIELKSPADAIELYKNIGKLNTISLVVLRNNQEKEIIYEIY